MATPAHPPEPIELSTSCEDLSGCLQVKLRNSGRCGNGGGDVEAKYTNLCSRSINMCLDLKKRDGSWSSRCKHLGPGTSGTTTACRGSGSYWKAAVGQGQSVRACFDTSHRR